MKLLILYFNFFRGLQKKKWLYGLRIPKFFTISSLTDKNQPINSQHFKLYNRSITSLSSSHLWDLYSPLVTPILE